MSTLPNVQIIGDPQQLVTREAVEVVFVNLLRNGIDHAGGKVIDVTLSATELIVANTVARRNSIRDLEWV